MQNRYIFLLIASLLILDTIAISLATSFLPQLFNQDADFIGLELTGLILVNVTWLASSLVVGLYSYNNVHSIFNVSLKTLKTFTIQLFVIVLITDFFPDLFISFNELVLVLFFEFFALSFLRIVIYLLETYYLNFEPYKKKIAILGDNDINTQLEKYFLKNKLSFDYTGAYLPDVPTKNDKTELKNFKRDIKLAIQNNLDEVYTTLIPKNNHALNDLLALAEQNCVRVKFVTSFLEFHNQDTEFVNSNYKLANFYDGIPILVARNEPLNLIWNRVIKRIFDIVFSLCVIVFLLSWLLPIIMILIRIESPGNTIFTQLRSGRNNKPFYCLKFRSMRLNNLSNEKQATKGDARITKIGAFMRRTSIDELPQFFNVLVGNMSVVGPRPHMLKHTEEYRQIIDQYMVRHYLKPGITGWAQINGHRGETKEHYQMLNRVEHDVWYMENWSLYKDLEIIYKTLANAARGEENAF